MIKQIHNLQVFVSDMDRSLAFYRDALGLPVRHSNAFAAEFDLDGFTFGLQYMNAAYLNQGVAVTIDFAVDDVASEVERLKAQGIDFTAVILDQPFGKLAKFRDPDGNLLGLFEQSE